MIASVRGTVQAVRLDAVIVEVGGVGMLVHATPATLAGLRVGATTLLSTSLVVREDSLTLYGFGDPDELAVFEIVQTVSGVGPRLALAMLAVHSPDGLRRAVAGEDLVALKRVPGIGHKGAQRIVLELGDRLGAASGPGADSSSPLAAAPADRRTEVVDALVGLGWNAKAADDAVTGVLASSPELAAPVSDLEVAAVLRAALRSLGSGRG
ncbi:Holliday junction branch migration protein RuvA [Pengzhenrongella frigida]|uniref:Holliday junction branch migration complex subunit RuvA n=1 Tax=Pengzhenrongella frigida TaxID=1259133 RepID=A0A4V1ZHQ3_9MICO|nr:Holliday junction branch migration protein RuvA [Cellulomonas sp. HLT2-17]RYV52844.1 Holliday junction branch migration protein RuvA [Cellulomonas sp. HLT2-17]